jgi:hypothetical protein
MSFRVKEFKEDKEEDDRLIWTTEKVNKLLESMEEGYQATDHPFYEGNPDYKKANLAFEYSDWEFDEIKKCAKDIIHFANLYCQVMTDEGYMKIQLRPYQEMVLRSYQENRWNIFLAPRQIGKCHIYTTKIKIRNKETLEESEVCIGDFYYSRIKPSILGKIKMFLYKIVSKLEN